MIKKIDFPKNILFIGTSFENIEMREKVEGQPFRDGGSKIYLAYILKKNSNYPSHYQITFSKKINSISTYSTLLIFVRQIHIVR